MRKYTSGKEVEERWSGSKIGVKTKGEEKKQEIFVDTSINEALSCDSV